MKDKNLLILGIILSWIYMFVYGIASYKIAGILGFVISLNLILIASIIGALFNEKK